MHFMMSLWIKESPNIEYEWTTELQIQDAEDSIKYHKKALKKETERLARLKSGVYDDI